MKPLKTVVKAVQIFAQQTNHLHTDVMMALEILHQGTMGNERHFDARDGESRKLVCLLADGFAQTEHGARPYKGYHRQGPAFLRHPNPYFPFFDEIDPRSEGPLLEEESAFFVPLGTCYSLEMRPQ